MTLSIEAASLSANIDALHAQLAALPSSKRLTYADTETIYADAYALVAQGRYADALKRFGLLILYRPSESKYWAGLGVCNQQLARYDEAISAFAFAANLDADEPEHMLAIAECELFKHSIADAHESLQLVIAFCLERGGFEKTRERAQALLDLVTKGPSPG